jgi:hypothetical protein
MTVQDSNPTNCITWVQPTDNVEPFPCTCVRINIIILGAPTQTLPLVPCIHQGQVHKVPTISYLMIDQLAQHRLLQLQQLNPRSVSPGPVYGLVPRIQPAPRRTKEARGQSFHLFREVKMEATSQNLVLWFEYSVIYMKLVSRVELLLRSLNTSWCKWLHSQACNDIMIL